MASARSGWISHVRPVARIRRNLVRAFSRGNSERFWGVARACVVGLCGCDSPEGGRGASTACPVLASGQRRGAIRTAMGEHRGRAGASKGSCGAWHPTPAYWPCPRWPGRIGLQGFETGAHWFCGGARPGQAHTRDHTKRRRNQTGSASPQNQTATRTQAASRGGRGQPRTTQPPENTDRGARARPARPRPTNGHDRPGQRGQGHKRRGRGDRRRIRPTRAGPPGGALTRPAINASRAGVQRQSHLGAVAVSSRRP